MKRFSVNELYNFIKSFKQYGLYYYPVILHFKDDDLRDMLVYKDRYILRTSYRSIEWIINVSKLTDISKFENEFYFTESDLFPHRYTFRLHKVEVRLDLYDR